MPEQNNLFILLMLMTWRLSSLFAREEGPLHLFDAIRNGLKWLASKEWIGQKVFISLWEGIHCIACNSVWFGALSALVLTRGIINMEWIIYTLSLSTGVIILELFMNWLKGEVK